MEIMNILKDIKISRIYRIAIHHQCRYVVAILRCESNAKRIATGNSLRVVSFGEFIVPTREDFHRVFQPMRKDDQRQVLRNILETI